MSSSIAQPALSASARKARISALHCRTQGGRPAGRLVSSTSRLGDCSEASVVRIGALARSTQCTSSTRSTVRRPRATASRSARLASLMACPRAGGSNLFHSSSETGRSRTASMAARQIGDMPSRGSPPPSRSGGRSSSRPQHPFQGRKGRALQVRAAARFDQRPALGLEFLDELVRQARFADARIARQADRTSARRARPARHAAARPCRASGRQSARRCASCAPAIATDRPLRGRDTPIRDLRSPSAP